MYKKIIPAFMLAAAAAYAVDYYNGDRIAFAMKHPVILTDNPQFEEYARKAAIPKNTAIRSENIERPFSALLGTWKADHTIYSARNNWMGAGLKLQVNKDQSISYTGSHLFGQASFNVGADGTVTGQVAFLNLNVSPHNAKLLARESGFCKMLDFAIVADPVEPRRADFTAAHTRFCPPTP